VGIGNGSAESTIDSDGGVELMDADELVRLSAEHRSLKEELEGIQRMFTRSGKRGSLSD
jgi:hypothetical protein